MRRGSGRGPSRWVAPGSPGSRFDPFQQKRRYVGEAAAGGLRQNSRPVMHTVSTPEPAHPHPRPPRRDPREAARKCADGSRTVIQLGQRRVDDEVLAGVDPRSGRRVRPSRRVQAGWGSGARSPTRAVPRRRTPAREGRTAATRAGLVGRRSPPSFITPARSSEVSPRRRRGIVEAQLAADPVVEEGQTSTRSPVHGLSQWSITSSRREVVEVPRLLAAQLEPPARDPVNVGQESALGHPRAGVAEQRSQPLVTDEAVHRPVEDPVGRRGLVEGTPQLPERVQVVAG